MHNRNLKLIVARDGRVNFPELGPIHVGGQSFNAVKADIEARVQRQMHGRARQCLDGRHAFHTGIRVGRG